MSSAEPKTPYPLQANQNLSLYLYVPQCNCADTPYQSAANMPVASSLIVDNLCVHVFLLPRVAPVVPNFSFAVLLNYNQIVHHVPQSKPVRQPPLYLNHHPSVTYSTPLH